MLPKDASQFWMRYEEIASKDFHVVLKTGIRQSTLSTWKKKKIFPRADEACLLAKAVNTSVEYLVNGQDETQENQPITVSDFNIDNSKITEEDLQILEKSLSVIHKIIRERQDLSAK